MKGFLISILKIVVVRSLSPVGLFTTPWTAAHQASLSFTLSRSLLRFISIEFVMLCNLPSSFASVLLSIRVFSSESVLHIRWPKYWRLASALVLPMNIQDWFPLGLSDLISLLSKGLWRLFSNTTAQKDQFFSVQSSLWSNSHIHTWLLGRT